MAWTPVGASRHIVSVIAPTTSRVNGYQVPGTGTTVLQNIPAAIQPLQGREQVASLGADPQSIVASLTHRITIRWDPSIARIKPSMKVTCTEIGVTREFDILVVVDVEERHRELQILAKEIVK